MRESHGEKCPSIKHRRAFVGWRNERVEGYKGDATTIYVVSTTSALLRQASRYPQGSTLAQKCSQMQLKYTRASRVRTRLFYVAAATW